MMGMDTNYNKQKKKQIYLMERRANMKITRKNATMGQAMIK